jgi:predicted amidohydrolase
VGGELPYGGDSAIVDPLGIVLTTGADSETILLADVDPTAVRQARERFGFLVDRRTHPVP